MDSRDDLARLVYDAARANSPVDAFGDDPRLAKYQSIWANAAATALLAAGWVPGELLAAEQARNATLTNTVERVRRLAFRAEKLREPLTSEEVYAALTGEEDG